MTRRRLAARAAVLVLVAGLSILFAFPLRPFFRDAILEPILAGWFLVRWYVGQISQLVLWDLFIAVVGLLLLRAILRGRGRGSRRPGSRRTIKIENELNQLAEAIRIAGRRPFFRALFQRDFAAVATEVVAQGERIPSSSALAWLQDERAHQRPGLAAFFADRDLERSIPANDDFAGKLDEALSFLEKYF